MNRQKGITLIALVITVIVLLILAGVAISTLTGNDNILDNAGTAVDKYNEKAEAEEAVLNTLEKKLIEFSNGGGTGTLQEDLEQNPEKYRHPDQPAEITDISVSKDGESVNLNLWHYQLRTDSSLASIASTETITGESYYELVQNTLDAYESGGQGHFYEGVDTGDYNYGDYTAYKGRIENGAIIGKIPAYIYNSATGKVIPVTKLTNTLSYLKMTTAPEIPSTVTEIGNYCFAHSKISNSITIPNTVTTIGNGAFDECEVSSITIPVSVTNMGADVFNLWGPKQSIYYEGDSIPSTWDSNWKGSRCEAKVYCKGALQE